MSHGPHTAVRSDPSGAAEADGDLVAVDDDRYFPTSLAIAEHPLEFGRVVLDVDVLERDMPPIEIFTGGLSIWSSVFAENDRHASIVPVTYLSPTCHLPGITCQAPGLPGLKILPSAV